MARVAKPKVEAKVEGAPTVIADLPEIPPALTDDSPAVNDLPVLPPIDETKPVVVMKPCELEDEAVGAKLVVLSNSEGVKCPTITANRGQWTVLHGDLAFTLPVGAKIRKVAEGKFEAIQLNHQRPQAPLICATAREAMERFVPYFHG